VELERNTIVPMRVGWIGALAATLWVEKVLLLLALAIVHEERFGALAIAAALAPELALAIVAVALVELAPVAAMRWIVGCATLALVLGTWLAASSWAYAGRSSRGTSSRACSRARKRSPRQRAPRTARRRLRSPSPRSRSRWRPAGRSPGLLGAVARRFPSPSAASRRLAAIIGLTVATAGLVRERRTAAERDRRAGDPRRRTPGRVATRSWAVRRSTRRLRASSRRARGARGTHAPPCPASGTS
jgi:hypothetical protein